MHYDINLDKNNPEITIKLPEKMLRDLAKRSEENGRIIQVEIMMRLARSLERDLDMVIEDNIMAALWHELPKQKWD